MSVTPVKDRPGLLRVEKRVNGARVVRYETDPKKAAKLDAMLAAGIIPDAGGKPASEAYSVASLWDDYKGEWRGHKDEGQSVARFKAACDCLEEALGITTLPEVDEGHLRKVARILEARGVGPATVNRYLATLSKALHKARRKINHPPTFKEVWLKTKKPETFALSVDQETRLREVLRATATFPTRKLRTGTGEDYALLLDVQIASGTRIGELVKLTPDDIVRHVEGNKVWYELMLKDPKNGEDRVAALRADMGERFLALVERGMPHYASIRRAMRYARMKAGLPTTQPTHAQRHTTATRLTQRGVPTAKIMKVMGHKSMATTLRYINLDTSVQREALEVLLGPEV